jgi:hypothetical protein
MMTLEELAGALIEMYVDAEIDKSAMPRLFGIRYAGEIRDSVYSPADIIRQVREQSGAEIPETYVTEINKGITLSKYVIEKSAIINFIQRKFRRT